MDKRFLRDFLVPTSAQVFWAIATSLLLTVFVYAGPLLSRLASGQNVPISVVSQTFTSQLAELNAIPAVQTAVIVLFWSLVGLCTFMVYAALRSSGSTVMDEVTIQREYTNRGHGKGRYTWVIVRLVASVALLVALQLMWRGGFGLWFGYIEQFILGSFSFGNFLSFLFGLAGLSVSLYGLYVLAHAAIVADRL